MDLTLSYHQNLFISLSIAVMRFGWIFAFEALVSIGSYPIKLSRNACRATGSNNWELIRMLLNALLLLQAHFTMQGIQIRGNWRW